MNLCQGTKEPAKSLSSGAGSLERTSPRSLLCQQRSTDADGRSVFLPRFARTAHTPLTYLASSYSSFLLLHFFARPQSASSASIDFSHVSHLALFKALAGRVGRGRIFSSARAAAAVVKRCVRCTL